ncbi:peptidase domain-containing ABC transporter [Flavobacterium dauae]|uniref:peptidase domain-containing ABC transporter n=1 Tax=Flavobacterium dauae TaxID=1563479 RepID=UPI00101B2A4D|nr:peptidase domain-containing ABC transporter [Flavobacterium dauae]WLD23307.1 peptidase domain-containing ABC transporter [Flavobacterium dauae]
MLNKRKIPFVKQLDSQDCGFACLKMIGKYYYSDFEIDEEIIQNSNILKFGISIFDLQKNANELGFEAHALLISFDKIFKNFSSPSIFLWNQNHFIVVYKIYKNKVYVIDPEFGKVTYTKEEFIEGWSQGEDNGVVLYIEPTIKLTKHLKKIKDRKLDLTFAVQYIKKYKVHFILIIVSLIISSTIELIFPFFTQKIVDKGVSNQNVNFIYLILVAQIILFFSKIGIEFYRSWMFMHISSRISFSIITDFLLKLTNLPINFFNSKTIGDLTQRINDHRRIEELLTKEFIQTIFSAFSIIIYASILLYFNTKIFFTVLICTIIEIVWILIFLDKIKVNDHKNFSLISNDRNKLYEIINSIHDIKLNNLEEEKTKQWQQIQKRIFETSIERLSIDQKYQSYRFFNFLQTILVIFFAAIAVMNHDMTVGTMLSIMFILGGIGGPVNQLITFILKYQLSKISFERLNDIHKYKEEDNSSGKIPLEYIEDIQLQNVNFSYDNRHSAIKSVNALIPKNKMTAIVGISGSGKTTLLKLLLKFYSPKSGVIKLGKNDLESINNKEWRKKCGVIFQDSVIFSDTIKYNVALTHDADLEKLKRSLQLANILSFVDNLPLKENMKIGSEGIGLSQGQRQRILIARAIYKNPDYLFFDEATNSLDAENEKLIVDNMNKFFENKTMIVVAHRLSTVKNADQILVLENGCLIESGTHLELIAKKGKYYSLIRNQLELGQ